MERRFKCTSCGKCCHGNIPLTLNDALRHAGRFPLALVWTPVPQGTKAFPLATRLGITLRLQKRLQLAVIIGPAAYMPKSLPCPELTKEGLCGIHSIKPSRCRTMPFYPYLEESEQRDLLVPRKGWECDTSAAAPTVYREGKIVDSGDFSRERKELLDQVPVMREYGDFMLKHSPWILENLKAVAGRTDGHIATSLSSFLTAIKHLDAANLAAQQLPVLNTFAELTANMPEAATYNRNYVGWAREMWHMLKLSGTQCEPGSVQ